MPDSQSETIIEQDESLLHWWRLDRRGMRLRWELIKLLPAASLSLTIGMLLVLAISSITPPFLMISVGRAVSAVGPAVRAGNGSGAARHLFVDLIVVGVLFAVGQ